MKLLGNNRSHFLFRIKGRVGELTDLIEPVNICERSTQQTMNVDIS